MLKNFFTKTERTIILFLFCTFWIGVAVRLFKQRVQSSSPSPETTRKFELLARAIREKADLPFREDSVRAAKKNTKPKKSKEKPSLSGPVNLNTAELNELTLLPRVGEAMARRIIDYRIQNGGFKSVDELKKIKGVGKKTFDQIQPHVVID